MTIVGNPRPVTGGVDTHLEVNVAAVVDQVGGLLGVESFPTTVKGNEQLLKWMAGFGSVAQVGVEGTSSYGASLARHLRAEGVEVVEVDRPNRQERRRKGKNDTVDAIEAARAAQGQRQLAGLSGLTLDEATYALVDPRVNDTDVIYLPPCTYLR